MLCLCAYFEPDEAIKTLVCGRIDRSEPPGNSCLLGLSRKGREENIVENEDIKMNVRQNYARIAAEEGSCCGPTKSCCGGGSLATVISKSIGYSEEEMGAVPEGANLGLGCGNPTAFASLKEGETVLDLGSGAGFDCFLAAQKVGKSGKVIGVDMTPEMLQKARSNLSKGPYGNVEFRLGEIENLPAADNSVDVIISNCVINLSTDKARVFAEALRVLRPGGRLMISDTALLRELPASIMDSVQAYVGCLSGSLVKDKYIELVKGVGFKDVRILGESFFPVEAMANDPTAQVLIQDSAISLDEARAIGNSVVSLNIMAVKPA